MKKQVVRTLTMALFSVMAMVVMVGAALGQSRDQIRINIPFDFTVGDYKLPAGKYAVGHAQLPGGDAVLLVSSLNNQGNVFRLTNTAQSVEPKHTNMLVFHRYGDEYFLFQVWPVGATLGREIPKSNSEREVARKVRYELGAAAQKPKRVEVTQVY